MHRDDAIEFLYYKRMTEFIKPPKALLRNVGKALSDFHMINDGDRILLGLSGGKDSLSLLHILHHFKRHAPIHFDIGIMTVDPQAESFDPSPLIPYVESLGLPYYFQQEAIVEMAQKHMDNDSYCAFCSRMKRGIMYTTARDNNYNVLVLAQHLDDLAESFLMSAFHGGQLKTMKANYTVADGDLRVIRPLVYTREKELSAFASSSGFPVIYDNCPACFAMPTQREHMKQLLAKEEVGNEQLFKSLKTAMLPLMKKSSA
ncbi:MAG: tRNA(Cytosine32)-2-thiocytidine synthetase [uncultured Thiotrichaceae bacterium]|uniref:tRNA(Cytosine32)-2-thiocytidine synthetase n=1 Tax=uncultured Thiotrichaceae bacterium TaxID=298394 RepID=A0A6S6TE87_9GAMM|nr:MAG: tRNA(Cytosine32)-2-thiocytidine synthetase [uncultured Thiotrichaceae bacterium]